MGQLRLSDLPEVTQWVGGWARFTAMQSDSRSCACETLCLSTCRQGVGIISCLRLEAGVFWKTEGGLSSAEGRPGRKGWSDPEMGGVRGTFQAERQQGKRCKGGMWVVGWGAGEEISTGTRERTWAVRLVGQPAWIAAARHFKWSTSWDLLGQVAQGLLLLAGPGKDPASLSPTLPNLGLPWGHMFHPWVPGA